MTPDLSDPYFLEHLRRAVCEDARLGETNVRVSLAGGLIWLTGHVGSEERRQSVERVIRALAPGFGIRNDLTVLVVTGPTFEVVR